MTSSIVDRYDVESGLYLGSFTSQRIPEYDALGSAKRIERPRGMGTPATHVTTILYDGYSLTPKETTVSSTDQGTTFRTQSTINTLRAQRTYWVFPTGASMIRYRDEFGRPTGEVVMPSGGTGNSRRVNTVIYDDDLENGGRQRSVTVVTYPGTAVDNSVIGAEQLERTYVDALGRPYAVQRSLGVDYGREWMAQAIIYDLSGRIAYRSTPQRTKAAPYTPDENALPYGTTYFYGDDGDLVGTTTGPGRAAAPGYSYPAGDIYATRRSKYFRDGRRHDLAFGPNDLDPLSDSFGDYTETKSSAIGWTLETSRGDIDMVAFDRVEHFHDRFGRESRTLRYGDGRATTEWRASYDSLGNVLGRTEPGQSPVSHSYDEWGGLLSSVWSDDEAQHYASWSYDGLGRPTEYRLEKRDIGDSLAREWTQYYYYDEHSDSPHQPQSPSLLGRLSWIHVPDVGTEFYGYDGLQQGVSTTTLHADDGVAYRTSQRLSVGGRLDAMTFDIPGRTESVAYTYDSADRLRRAALSAGSTTSDLFTANQFDDLGRYRDLTFGNGVRELFDYAPAGRQLLKSWSVVGPSSMYERIIDGRDADGRITALSEVSSALPGDETDFAFSYDRLGRLTHSRATGRVNRDESFTYDALGNLLSGSDMDVEYAYTNGFDKDRLTAVGLRGSVLQPLQYDGAGNVKLYTPVGKPSVALTYDGASRVTSLTSANGDQARFTYGPGGSLFRELVVTAAGETDVRHYGSAIERRTRPDGRTHAEMRVPGPLGTLVSLRREGTAKNDYQTVTAEVALYPHGDAQGNRFFTDEDGSVVQTAQYRAFGSLSETTGSPGSLLYTDDLWNAGDTYDSFGVTLLGARVYDPVVGRFLQRDPIRAIGSASRANPYGFSWGDPVNMSDPTGLFPFPVAWLAATLNYATMQTPLTIGAVNVAVMAGGMFFSAPWSRAGGFAATPAGRAVQTLDANVNLFSDGVVQSIGSQIQTGAAFAQAIVPCVLTRTMCGGAIELAGNLAAGTVDLAGKLVDDPVGTLHTLACEDDGCDAKDGGRLFANSVTSAAGSGLAASAGLLGGAGIPNRVVTGFHGTKAAGILGIIEKGGFIPRAGRVFLGDTVDSTFLHGVDRLHKAAFSIEVDAAVTGRAVERLATPGVPSTTIVHGHDLVPATVKRMFVRTPDGAGGFQVSIIEGVGSIKAFFGLY